MIRSMFQILRIDDPSRTEYLSPLTDLVRKQGSLTIATLNYDRSVENVAEAAGEPYDTGIETWLESGVLDWPEKGLRLLKLHGLLTGSSNVQISSASFRSSASAKSLARMRRHRRPTQAGARSCPMRLAVPPAVQVPTSPEPSIPGPVDLGGDEPDVLVVLRPDGLRIAQCSAARDRQTFRDPVDESLRDVETTIGDGSRLQVQVQVQERVREQARERAGPRASRHRYRTLRR
jgi:hypothetical protein